MNKKIDTYVNRINEDLSKYFSNRSCIQHEVYDAMNYSLNAGGKRIRGLLAMEFYQICGGKNDITQIASAIEMAHTFSLIHDDLPCMDNDDYRRGKPSCHKAFTESTAVLAGDALAIYPFELISECALNNIISSEIAIKVIKELSSALSSDGMIGGQIIDIDSEDKQLSIDDLVLLDKLKTGALINASCRIGCICAGASDEILTYATQYAYNLGIAFQIKDDILDVEGTFEQLGKPINSDEENSKSTYVSIYGIDKAKQQAEYYTEKAIESLSYFKNNDILVCLTNNLLYRKI